MSNTAITLYNQQSDESQLNNYISGSNIEHLYFDAKEAPIINGALNLQSVDKILCKAITGFANSDGGVIAIGIKEKKDRELEQSEFLLVPFSDCTALENRVLSRLISYSSPSVGGVLTKVLRATGPGNSGYLLIFVPRSDSLPHQNNDDKKYYQRFGSSFKDLHHYQIENLFSLRRGPNLRVIIRLEFDTNAGGRGCLANLYVLNRGSSMAKHIQLTAREIAPQLKRTESNSGGLSYYADKPTIRIYRGSSEEVVHVNSERLVIRMNAVGLRTDDVTHNHKLIVSGEIACDGQSNRAFKIVATIDHYSLILERKEPIVEVEES